MSMLFSGSNDYVDCSMFYCAREDSVFRLEIYNGKENEITQKWVSDGYTVTTAIATPREIVRQWESNFSRDKNIGYY